MVLPLHFKRRPFVLALCLGFGPAAALGAAADWNCQRSPDGQDWICSSGKDKPGKTAEPARKAAPPDAAGEPPKTAAPSGKPAGETEPAAESGTRAAAPRRPASPDTTATQSPPERPGGPESGPSTAAAPERPNAPTVEPEQAAAPPEMKRIPDTGGEQPAEAAHPSAFARRAGWTCRPAGEGREWDCSLVGPDPRGEAHAVGEAAETAENWAESTTITEQDEQRFRGLFTRLPANPWAQACAGKREAEPMTEFLLTREDKAAREKAPVEVRSNYFEMADEEVADFSGTAELIQADQKLWADFISHNTVTNTLNARGNVIYQEKGFTFSSDTGFLDMDTNRGTFRNGQFILETIPARGTARITHLENAALSRYETFTYTSCPPGDRDWLLHADQVKINRETGRGSATHAWLEFKDVPFLYTPYMSFPIDDRRQTGFLAPSFDSSRVGGFAFTVPYYFNLAPNYDYTFTPRYLTQRGILLRNEFRYLHESGQGFFLGEIMPEDSERNTARGQVGWQNLIRLTDNLSSRIDAHFLSDKRYLNELGSALNIVDRRFVRSYGNLNYSGSNYSVHAMADYFQTIDPTIVDLAQPYYRLPQVQANFGDMLGDTGLLISGHAQMDYFRHDGEDDAGNVRVTGIRGVAQPRISYPLYAAAGFVNPSVSLRHVQYWLEDQTPGQSDTPSITLPIFSLDSGLFFEREFENSPLLQTLEPRLFYVYIPKQDQDEIPVFDSSEYDFTFYQLFRENRFTGYDRLGDANQVTTALTSRLIDQESGLERLRASVGSIFYLDPPDVSLFGPTVPPRHDNYSNIVTDLYSGLTENWSFRVGGQWDPERERIDRGMVGLQYNNRHNEVFNIAYRFRRDQNADLARELGAIDVVDNTLDLTDVSLRLPVAEGWHAIGRWQYSFQHQDTLEALAGIERETCCWRFTLLGRQYINLANRDPSDPKDTDTQTNYGVFVQLELKGLSRLGDQVDRLLERSISGYRLRQY
jgi:LPS-assembly protein